ncbi:hypothetical protein OCK74_27245 [Chitinophagaceae bacterium LB-8]|uniref:Uncharacterized protein n=1 Tax=Paraflavisolibacter caeni TaxID=2982496 RepID=A0A9X3BA23_9BACT|nr:hypothetical protein [Paraflavisolibacter caeni]MCU7552845.1 hypothetical protein [Paraflavisolibacter caeni]
MTKAKTYHRPYSEPEPRSFVQWCIDLGVECEGKCPDASQKLTYDEFCFLPDVRLIKVRDTELYGWWRKHGDVWGECRTVKEWLEDFNWELVDPTDSELKDVNLFIGHDEFWVWSSGKVTDKIKKNTGILKTIRRLFNKN